VDRRAEVDPFTGEMHVDPRTSGASEADEAALEWALTLGDAWGVEVVAATAGPSNTEPMLRDAVAVGASHALRVDLPEGASSSRVAVALAHALPPAVALVVCGVWSVDRGSGSVPAFLAAELGAAQALGVVGLTVSGKTIVAERRLDGGRRERLRIASRAVLSVEGGSARLRRAALDDVLASLHASVDVVSAPVVADVASSAPVRTMPFRPRARMLPAPARELDARERILALTGALVDHEPPRVVRLDPASAADELLTQLETWGYR
jgi:electron transfer flavoprotein beta subunit